MDYATGLDIVHRLVERGELSTDPFTLRRLRAEAIRLAQDPGIPRAERECWEGIASGIMLRISDLEEDG